MAYVDRSPKQLVSGERKFQSKHTVRSPRSVFRVCIEGAGRVGDVLATALILILTAVIGYEVIARYLFSSPTGFANQFAAYSMPAITFLAAAATLRKNGHVTVDALINVLGSRPRAGLEVLTEAFSVLVVAAVTVAAVMLVHESWESGTRTFSTAVSFPEYLPQMVMAVGLSLLALQQVFKLIDAVHRYRSGRK